ncbi:MAG: DUF2279 domain-containing protein [Myxococcales bacterium]
MVLFGGTGPVHAEAAPAPGATIVQPVASTTLTAADISLAAGSQSTGGADAPSAPPAASSSSAAPVVGSTVRLQGSASGDSESSQNASDTEPRSPRLDASAKTPFGDQALPAPSIVVSPSNISTAAVTTAPSVRRGSPMSRALSLGLVGGIYVGMNVLAYFAWWADSPPDQFEWVKDGWFAPNTYAGGSDKIGHFYMNLFLTRANASVLEQGGWHRRTATYAGAMLTLGMYYVFEMRDAYSTGFSKNDMIANTVGAATGVLMREVPLLDELFDFRVEYIPSNGYLKNFKKEGVNFNEDYTGLTFLFAWHVCSVPFLEENAGPFRFMDVVLGYNSRNYRPRTPLNVTRYQDRFIGVSLNLQRIVDELWLGKRHPKFGESAGNAHRFTQFATEFFNLPYTSIPVGTWTNEYHRPIRRE